MCNSVNNLPSVPETERLHRLPRRLLHTGTAVFQRGATVNLLPIGFRSGKLTVIKSIDGRIHGIHYAALCRCDCGRLKRVKAANIRARETKSCGCSVGETIDRTHGKCNSKEYVIWAGMKARCNNPNHGAYQRYGGIGISVCKAWRESFAQFLKDMGYRPSDQHSIERLDNSKGYSPDNCVWALLETQANNRSNNNNLTHNGVTQSLARWARQLNIPRPTLSHWVNVNKWNFACCVERAKTYRLAPGEEPSQDDVLS
jgi:hypothetical protein